ncbi:MAG: DUF4296 domain-containing protein [Flavobacteriales bacterium]|nr:DUF4296 domain-containing protein [Flavobacteriales bacterium]
MKKVIYIIALILISCGDNNKIPPEVIPKDKFTDILFDIEIIDAIHTQKNAGVAKNDIESLERYNLVFETNKVSQKEFQDSFEFYQKEPNHMMEISDSLIARLIREEAKVSEELRKKRWRTKSEKTQ